MHEVVIRNGSVLTSEGIIEADVSIDDGVVTGLGDEIADGVVEVDAKTCWVGPGFVDIHTHLREPGYEWKEDIASGSAAAAAGGYTAVVAMPNTEPAIDNGPIARFVAERGSTTGLVDVFPAGTITMGRAGETMAHIDELWDAGVRLFTDDGDAVGNAAVLRLVMEYVAQLGGVISQHAVDPALSLAGYMHEGAVSSRLGMYGIPSAADHVVIDRDLELVRATGVRYHVQHLSSAGGVERIAAAKAEGLPVTAEVTPHHLMFTEEDVAGTDPDFKMMPPLRRSEDREALVHGLTTGTIDVVATDHAPHAALEKEVPFEHAPNGVIGLEWCAAVVNGEVGLDPVAFFDRMSTSPAAIAQIAGHGEPLSVGANADVVVFDPNQTWTPTTSESKSRNAPYLGRSLTGRVRATIHDGRVTAGGG